MEDIRNNLKISDTLKINLIRAINNTDTKDTDEEYEMNLYGDNIELVVYDKLDEAIKIL